MSVYIYIYIYIYIKYLYNLCWYIYIYASKEITGIEAEDVITEHLSSHHWNLEAAVQDALNVKEGIRPIFGTMPPSAPLLQFTPPNEPRGGRDVIAGSVQWGTGGRRRMDVMRREGWLEWSMNLAIFPLRFILGVANEMFQLMGTLHTHICMHTYAYT